MDLLPPTITSRRHPVVLASYVMTLVFGLIFVTHYGHTATNHGAFHDISHWAVFMWKWELTLGSALALFSTFFNGRQSPKWPDLADLLRFESIGALVSGIGLTTYLIAVGSAVHWQGLAPGIAIYGALAIGRFWRGVQCLIESSKLVRWANIVITMNSTLGKTDDE